MHRCWECKKEVKGGKPVRMDPILKCARAIKRFFGKARWGDVVVCPDCEAHHAAKEKGYDSAMLKFGVAGLLACIIYGWFSNWIAGLFWGLFVFALSLFKYSPKVVE